MFQLLIFINLKFYTLLSYFENLAISILDLFDKNESDYFNDNLLLTKNPHFGVHLLSFSNNAECEKFMATSCAQKVLNEIWNNGILFSHGKKIYFRNSFANVIFSFLSFFFSFKLKFLNSGCVELFNFWAGVAVFSTI